MATTTKTAETLKFVYSGIMIGSRALQLYFLLPLKDSQRKYKAIDSKIWIVFGIIEVIGLGITATFSSYRGITSATSIIEVFVFFGQYIYSQLNVAIQNKQDEGKD
jgi:quinol-cytochrome oxidoreductase complex cytochrome b subunit